MARFSRLAVYNTILDCGLVPLFYHANPQVARQVVEALQAGGGRVVEFTNRGDFAFQVFTSLAQHLSSARLDIVLGVGSVLDAPTAALYIASGADFVVGPALNPEVARLCNRRKIPYLPGCATVSEISAAEELGVEITKIFPGEAAGGPAFVKAVLGPLPWARLMPTGGVDATEESISGWFKAGVCAVGMGSNLVTRSALVATEKGDQGALAGISERTAQILAWIQAARSGR